MIRIAGHSFPPLWVAMLRCALGAILLWIIMRIRGNTFPPRRLLPWLLLVALLNNAIPFTCFAWGERTVPSNVAALLNATTTIWTLLFSMAVYRTRATALTIAGVLVSFLGILLVIATHGTDSALERGSASILVGSIIIGLAAVAYAIATIVAKLKLKGLDPIGLATTQLSLAALMLMPVALAGERPSQLQLGSVGAIVVLGFAGSGIAYLLYYRLLEHVTPTQLAAVTYLLPIWGLFWGLFAHESISFFAYVGVVITIGGLVLLNMRKAPQRADSNGQAPKSQSGAG